MIQTNHETATSFQPGDILTAQETSDQEKDYGQTLRGEHLYALLLKLRAQRPGILQTTAGELAQGALLRWFAAVDETLAIQLHRPNQRRPFTCSCVWESGQHAKRERSVWRNRPLSITTGSIYWLRVTLLSEGLFRPFMARYLQTASLPGGEGGTLGLPQFQLGQINFDVVEMLSSSPASGETHGYAHASHWSGHTTYQELIDAALAEETTGPTLRTIGLEFCSPTAFSNGNAAWKHHMYRLPTPDRVFSNLARSWNIWAPPSFYIDQKELQLYCQQWVDISDYELHTDTMQLTHAPQKGFLGRCFYSVMEKDAHTIMPKVAALSPAQCLHLLQQFSFYAGTGTKTAMGMGQTRPLTRSQR